MKYAINLPNFGAFGFARRAAEFAVLAEESGWDGVFIWDHINRPYITDIVDPWVALSAIAAATRTIRFGAMITPVPRRRPWKLARETVSLDHLSEGRLIFGAGLGSSRPAEWENLGEEHDANVRANQLDEGLEILTRLWSGESVTFKGEMYTVNGVRFLPASLQKPRIPVWIGGNWPAKAPFQRAARWDGVFPMFNSERAPVLDQIRECRSYLESRQSLPPTYDFAHLGESTFGLDPDQAGQFTNAYRQAGVTWWMEPLWPVSYGCSWEDTWPMKKFLERVKQGPPVSQAF